MQDDDVDDGVRTPKDITVLLQAAQTIQQLHRACMRHYAHLNYIHAAAAITRLAKLNTSSGLHTRTPSNSSHHQQQQRRPSPPSELRCITDVVLLVATHCAEFQPRALANALWAVSKLALQLHHHPQISLDFNLKQQASEPQHNTFQPFISQPDSAARGEADELQTARCAVLDLAAYLSSYLPQLASEFEPQHCANALHALSNLRQVQGKQMQPPATQLQRQLQEQQQQWKLVEAQAPFMLSATSPAKLTGMSPQGLANTLHAVAHLGLSPDEAWMCAWLDVAEVRGVSTRPCVCAFVYVCSVCVLNAQFVL